MYHRDLLTQLRQWSKNQIHKPMVIRGARQVGKSTLVREFGKDFDTFVEVNLELLKDASIFIQTDNVEEIWQYLCLRNHIVSDPNKKQLLFIDEIQELPKAVALLRYFQEKMPWLYVITAGSRLQNLLKTKVSFPVARVEYLNLRPFSFMEYIHAIEGEEWYNMIEKLKVSPLMHERLINHFNQYALIGGMPEVVSTFIDNPQIPLLSPIFNSLLKGYNEDVEHYAKNEEQIRIIQHILKTAWISSAETITFAKFGNSSYSSSQIHDAMNCLERAYLMSLDYPVTSTKLPMLPALQRSPKLIMLDTGITNFVAGIQIQYLQNKDLLDTWRGKAAEQIVAQELRVLQDRSYHEDQDYWIRDKKGTKAEIDFVWQQDDIIIPIEVKAGTNSHLKSLHSFVNNSEHYVTAVRFWSGELSVQDVCTPAPHKRPYRLINIPFYYIGQLPIILKNNMN